MPAYYSSITTPITRIKLKKQLEENDYNPSILASVSANGYIAFWHATSGKAIIVLQDPNDADLYSLDFSHDN